MGIAPDVLINDRYRLVERVALGSTGQVWRASDLVLHRQVAIKILHPERLDDEDFRHRFRAEARHAAQLSHPGVAEVHDYGEQGELAYLVMEYLPGRPLAAVLDEHRQGRVEDGPARGLALGVEATLEIVAQVARALQAAHNLGLIHRDIKPANLIVGRDGDVKITDFGTARAMGASTVTEPGVVVGTAQYLSPEQAGGQPLTPATDIYALGIVAYACLTGDPPFGGASPVEIAAAHVAESPPPLPRGIPDPVLRLVEDCLAKDPEDRPSSAGEVADRCGVARAAWPRPPASPGRLPVRRPAPLSAALAGAALAVGGMLLLGTGHGFTPSMPIVDDERIGIDAGRAHPRPQPGPAGGNPSGGTEIGASPGDAAVHGEAVSHPRTGRDLQRDRLPSAPSEQAQGPAAGQPDNSPSTRGPQPTSEATAGSRLPSTEPSSPGSTEPSSPGSSEAPTPRATPTPGVSGTTESLDESTGPVPSTPSPTATPHQGRAGSSPPGTRSEPVPEETGSPAVPQGEVTSEPGDPGPGLVSELSGWLG